MDRVTLAKGLGVFSLALGAAELLAPAWMRRAAGLSASRRLVRAFGVREVAAGLLTLAPRFRRAGLWSRVAGDGLDLATLALLARRRATARVATAAAMVAGIAALDLVCALRRPSALAA